MSFSIRILASLTLALGLAPTAILAGDITIHDPYMRTTGTSLATGAAFMIIMNMSDSPDRLVAAQTSLARKAELHTHKETADGIMLMREIEGGIEIPAGGKAVLQRGGDHVMLMGLTNAPAQGDEITLTLTFENAGELHVTVPVDQTRKPGTAAQGHSPASD